MRHSIYKRMAAAAVLVATALLGVAPMLQGQQAEESPAIEPRAIAGKVNQTLTNEAVIANPVKSAQKRAIFDVSLPAILDSVDLDVAELVVTVSTISDSTDPLILTVAPVTDRSALENLGEVEDWVGNTEGFSTKYASIVPVTVTQESAEIRFDITPIVEMWLKGQMPNRGLVVRALSEEKSTFQLTQTGIYDGANARLEIMYSRR
jgi:hypothetical protein